MRGEEVVFAMAGVWSARIVDIKRLRTWVRSGELNKLQNADGESQGLVGLACDASAFKLREQKHGDGV